MCNMDGRGVADATELLDQVVVASRALGADPRLALHGGGSTSVETLVHALLPHTAVLHSHADAILTLTNTADGEKLVRALYGSSVVVVPYVMSGPDLVEACSQAWDEQSHGGTRGVVVLNHGVFAVGDSPLEALDRHRALIEVADRYLVEHAPAADLLVTEALPDADTVEHGE